MFIDVRQICSMVRVPTPEEEDAKRPHRERERLVQEKQRLEKARLLTQGLRGRPSLRSWERDVEALETADGRPLPPLLRAEIDHLRHRLVLALAPITEVEAERTARQAATSDDRIVQKISALQRSRGSGENFSAVLVGEVLYRPFANRRQLAIYVGIAPMPYQSGGMDRDRHIGRAGNPRARDVDPACLAMASLPAGRRARSLVPRAGRHAARAHPANCDRRDGTKIVDRALALPRNRTTARWRRDQGASRHHGVIRQNCRWLDNCRR